MRKLLTLALVAGLSAACHNRSEEEVGAAPDQGEADTTAVTHAIDSTRTGPPGVGGRPGDATVTLDSVGVDTATVEGGDTGTTGLDTTTSPTSTPQDTLGPSDIGADDAADTTVTTGSDTTGGWNDTTGSDTTTIDTTGTNQ